MRVAFCAPALLIGCAVGPSPTPAPSDTQPTTTCPACPRCPDAPPPVPTPTGAPVAKVDLPKGLSYSCEAELAAHQEISRLLVAATAHATSSGACVDGPGNRVTADDVLVCPWKGSGQNVRVFRVAYQVTNRPEGDTRGCGGSLEACGMNPTASRHDTQLRFKKTKAGWTLEVPGKLPGIDMTTPLSKPHDGDCYGTSPPFSADPIALR